MDSHQQQFTQIVSVRLDRQLSLLRGNSKIVKRVHFTSDVRNKVRPTQTNLRPLERIIKKAKNDTLIDQLIRSLHTWDFHWRVYLQTYYDDDMQLRIPRTKLGTAEFNSRQQHLELLAGECARIHNQIPLRSAGATVSSSLSWKISMRENIHRQLLKNMVDAVTGWRKVEQRRWSCMTSQPELHDAFCEYVERLEVYQKKYKSVGDGIRRLKKRATREQLEEVSLIQQGSHNTAGPKTSMMA